MTLRNLKSTFQTSLKHLYPANEINTFYSLLLDYKLGLTNIDVALQPNNIIKQKDLDFFTHALAELKQEKPIQYILGETEFYGLKFKVNNNVLIPRPETEELVAWVLKETDKTKQLTILDIGTGSGCIAISLAKQLPKATVIGLDISAKALKVAKQNAMLNKVDVEFINENILDFTSYKLQFDIIVSNPPYVRELEKQEIKNNVLLNEPHLALFVEDNNPLLFYDKIADFAKKHLTKKGFLYFEINQYLSAETTNLLKEKGYKTITLKKDLFNNYRMLKATL